MPTQWVLAIRYPNPQLGRNWATSKRFFFFFFRLGFFEAEEGEAASEVGFWEAASEVGFWEAVLKLMRKLDASLQRPPVRSVNGESLGRRGRRR
ncbi:hypothetical protein ACFX2K_031910 [Malus domestica]